MQTRITSSVTFPDFIAPGLILSDTSIKTDLTQNTSGVVLAAVARYPLGGRWEAFGRLGVFSQVRTPGSTARIRRELSVDPPSVCPF